MPGAVGARLAGLDLGDKPAVPHRRHVTRRAGCGRWQRFELDAGDVCGIGRDEIPGTRDNDGTLTDRADGLDEFDGAARAFDGDLNGRFLEWQAAQDIEGDTRKVELTAVVFQAVLLNDVRDKPSQASEVVILVGPGALTMDGGRESRRAMCGAGP